jgi:hypothetical protein
MNNDDTGWLSQDTGWLSQGNAIMSRRIQTMPNPNKEMIDLLTNILDQQIRTNELLESSPISLTEVTCHDERGNKSLCVIDTSD